jgi:phosphate ABC transporter permease protein PstC
MLFPRNIKESIIKNIFFISAALSIFIIFFIFYFLFQQAYPAFQHSGVNIFSNEWVATEGKFGIGAAIYGTIIVTIGAMIISIPLGIAGAIFLSEIAPSYIRTILKPLIELIAGVPSIVFGFIGIIILVKYLQPTFGLLSGYTFLAGSLILGIMAVPIIVSMSDDAMKSVPRELKEGSLALGATKWQTIKKVIIPTSISGISAAVILGIGRAVGETMAVSLVLANTMQIPIPPWNIFQSTGSTITSLIFTHMGEGTGLETNALFASAVILFFIVAAMSIASNILKERVTKKFRGG